MLFIIKYYQESKKLVGVWGKIFVVREVIKGFRSEERVEFKRK